MLNDKARDLAEGRNFAVVSTLLESGQPQTHMMWVDTDGTHILLNTEVHRLKFKNISLDPRATVMVFKDGDPWNYAEIRGQVIETITGPEARAHIDKLAKKYLGKDEYTNPIQSERVILKIAPDRVVNYPAGS